MTWSRGVHVNVRVASAVHPYQQVHLMRWTWTLDLQPLLVSKMRDKCTAIPSVDADLFPGRPVSPDRFVYRRWTLEVRGIGRKLAHDSHQALDLLWSGCGMQ